MRASSRTYLGGDKTLPLGPAQQGVTVLPVSALYATPDVDHLVRFCFCKKTEVLQGALDRLRDFFGK